jgi:pyridoxamine 5'-phosphate oxidase
MTTLERIEGLRMEYSQGALDEGIVLADPVAQFGVWFEQALRSALAEPNAMTLATVDDAGRPNARMVLLKGFDADGFVFYTNYESRKGGELEATPEAALVCYWAELERQVRIRGAVSRTSTDQSEAYFGSRPLGSRVAAAVSPQSQVISGRKWLEERCREAELNPQVARPAHWGGYRMRPATIEFWQGRANRLHDRILYSQAEVGGWRIERLAP